MLLLLPLSVVTKTSAVRVIAPLREDVTAAATGENCIALAGLLRSTPVIEGAMTAGAQPEAGDSVDMVDVLSALNVPDPMCVQPEGSAPPSRVDAIASGIAAKGGEGGVIDKVESLASLSSPTPSNVTTAFAMACALLVVSVSLLLNDSSLAIAKLRSTSWSMFSAAIAIEAIDAAIESRNP